MNREQFQRVADLFQRAARLDGDARVAFLDGATADQPELRVEVERLLAADDDVPSYFEDDELAAGAFRRAADAIEDDDALHPKRIGDYEILGVLGRGGMGIVYRARRPERPEVALKVVRSGLLTAHMLRRFELEAHVLSRLRHPGIARILDLGTFDGEEGPRPYFAMEYVDGPTLLDYAISRGLDVEDRLRLVRDICAAVQYAHTKGVIHRDLKPANILVEEATERRSDGATKGPQPKVLDFGVARATDMERVATTLRTSTGQLVGTLRYMSPEQVGANPNDIDTRSDVYALGVLAYELLTDRLPYDIDQLALPNAARVIREVPPAPVDRRLRGDVETVLRRALEKDRERRYQSPAALAADISRLLDDEPIEARRDSTWYVARKLAARHRGPLAAALGFLALGAVLLGVMVHNSIDRSRRAEEATKLPSIFFDENATTDPFRAGARSTPEKLAAFSAWVDASLEDLPLVEANSRRTIGLGYLELGMYEEAETQLSSAVARRRATVDGPHEDLARDLELLARARYQGCKYLESAQSYEQAIDMRRTLHGGPHVDLASAIDGLAACLKSHCRFSQAEIQYQEALEMRRSLLGDDDPWVAASMNNLATCRHLQGRVDEAEAMFIEALALAERAEVKPLFLARGRRNVARCLLQRGDPDGAERIVRQALAELESSPPDHPDVAACLELLGRCALIRGDLEEATQHGTEALAIQLAKLPAPHNAIAKSQCLLSEVSMERGRIDEAETLLDSAIVARRALFVHGHPYVLATERRIAEGLLAQGRVDEARAICDRVLRSQQQILADEDPEVWASMTLLGRIMVAQDRPAEAEPYLRRALRLAEERLPGAHWTVVRGQVALAQCLSAQSRFDEAEMLLRRAQSTFEEGVYAPEHRRAMVREALELALATGEQGEG